MRRHARYWFGRYLLVLGGVWLLSEPAGVFFPGLSVLGWSGFAGVNVLAALITAVAFWPRRSLTIRVPGSTTTVGFSVSDLLEATGSVVIGTNDCFDTEIGDIIRPESVQGQFLQKVYSGDRAALDADIDAALAGVAFETDDAKPFGKKKRYPVGTVACVKKGGNRYFLLAFCRMRPEMRVEADARELWVVLQSCWDAVRDYGQHLEVHVPVLGTKYGRTGLSWNSVIQLIVMSFVISLKEGHTAPALQIHVHKSDRDMVDFIALREWLLSL